MASLEHARDPITATTLARMMARSRSCYARQGETACRRYIAALLDHTGDSIDAPMRAHIQDWLFELVWVASVRFMAQREQLIHERAAASEVRHLEAQLAELRASYEVKLELLEVMQLAIGPI